MQKWPSLLGSAGLGTVQADWVSSWIKVLGMETKIPRTDILHAGLGKPFTDALYLPRALMFLFNIIIKELSSVSLGSALVFWYNDAMISNPKISTVSSWE